MWLNTGFLPNHSPWETIATALSISPHLRTCLAFTRRERLLLLGVKTWCLQLVPSSDKLFLKSRAWRSGPRKVYFHQDMSKNYEEKATSGKTKSVLFPSPSTHFPLPSNLSFPCSLVHRLLHQLLRKGKSSFLRLASMFAMTQRNHPH